MTEKTTSHIDTRTKVCYTCSRKAIIVIDKTYYCADCSLWCEMAGTNQEYVKKLFDNLQYNYNSGKITKNQLRFGIRKLEKKI
jgi:hypothetical protein